MSVDGGSPSDRDAVSADDDLAIGGSARRSSGTSPLAPQVPVGGSLPPVVTHLTMALIGYVQRLRHGGLRVPSALDELVDFLVKTARDRQEPTFGAPASDRSHPAPMTARLLVTKAEVAERLSVSVRTVERLVAAGRLPQVYVEHSARIRVTDLEDFVATLATTPCSDPQDTSPGKP